MEDSHTHDCPLCDEDFECVGLHCEDEKSMVCADCEEPEEKGK
jgi:hypothetical protein